MTKKITLALLTTIATLGIISCNSDVYEGPIETYSNVAVTSFSLYENDNVLKNLDSVFFTIDMSNATIYNADSLPYGTKINKLPVSIVTAATCSTVELIIPNDKNDNDTINYLKNSTDSINFSNGAVTLHIVSADYTNECKYKITVNVHQTKPDSLCWTRLESRSLPSIFAYPQEQKTVEYKGNAICLTRLGKEYCLATTENPGNDNWDKQSVEFPFIPDMASLSATTEALYILDNEGNLYNSTDGIAWTACNQQWAHIYGGYGATLLGAKTDGNEYFHVTYPASDQSKISTDFPVSGTSQMLVFDNQWSSNPQAIIIGGKCADGHLTGATWSYDGNEWAKISNTPLPARQKMTLIPYFSYKTNSNNWSATKYSTLIAMFGENEIGLAEKTVYISLDQGLNWKEADELMQIGNENIPSRYNAQALVFTSTINARSTSLWNEAAVKNIPNGWIVVNPFDARAITTVTEWECPYIYLFGGENGSVTYNTIWRGVINRLSYKPII